MLEPDRCGEAARRLAAKMVADQAVDVMVSIVGQSGALDLDAPTAGVVIVARGAAAHGLLALLTKRPPASIEVEPCEPR